jgi:hypothetical protein
MVDSEFLPDLSSFAWHRVRAELVCVCASQRMTEHPFAVMEAIVKSTTELAWPSEPRPPVIFHITGRPHTFKLREGVRIPLEVLLFQCTDAEAGHWRHTFVNRFVSATGVRNFVLDGPSELERRLWSDLQPLLPLEAPDEVCLEFLSPVPFKLRKKKQQTYIDKETFIKAFESRISRLFGSSVEIGKAATGVHVLPYYWRFTKIRHKAKSDPGRLQEIRGCFGKLYLKGTLKNILPLLLLGAEVHAGTKLSNAQGYYLLHFEAQPYFDRGFPNPKALVPVIRDVCRRYEMPLETACGEASMPDEKVLADELCRDFACCTYVPSPATAFEVPKKDGTSRLIEQLTYRDLAAQQYVLKTISGAIERMFEPESIGFRKGMSRARAVELVQQAVADGYQYVIESDIEDFFPSVRLDVLQELLDFYIPSADSKICAALSAIISSGYVLGGRLYQRTKGLAQGSPLSPLLANLYLDSFDEHVAAWNVRLIRFADDFIVSAKG